MRAITYTRYGSSENLHLEEIEKPVPGKGEVLVKVRYASVNSWDVDLVRGTPFLVRIIGGLFSPRNKVLGADISGVVEAVGKVTSVFKPGDEVFGDIAAAGFGGFAEFVAVPEKWLAHKPTGLSFQDAAAIPQAGLLAWQGLLFGGGIKQGQEILINGAGGGVGTLALQYAKMAGAVVTCVDLPEKFDVLQSLGADHLLDCTREDYTRTGKTYDLILDVIAQRSLSDYQRALKPGGTFSMIGGDMSGRLMFQLLILGSTTTRDGKKVGLMGYRPTRDDLNLLARLCVEGRAKPIIDKIYPLAEVPQAIDRLASGKAKGKILIAVSG